MSGNNMPWISLINCEQLAMDQTDLWQVPPRQVFRPYSRLLISTAFIVSRVGCLGVTGIGKGNL